MFLLKGEPYFPAGPSAFSAASTYDVSTISFAVILPWIEAIVGVLLLAGAWTREAGLMVAGLLLSFNLAAVSVLARGIDVENCGCTSVGAARGPRSPFHSVGVFLLTRNAVLLAAALALALAPRREGKALAPEPVGSPVLTP